MEKIKSSIKSVITDTKSEAKETKEMMELIWASKNKTLTPEQKDKIKTQGLDLFKLTVLGALFIVPGSGILIVFLIKFGKRFGINILPSSFDKKKDNE